MVLSMHVARLTLCETDNFPGGGGSSRAAASLQVSPANNVLRRGDDADALLLERITTGDSESYRLLVERHTARAYDLSFRVLRNQAAAEAAVHDTMLAVWANGACGAIDRSKFTIWLYRAILTRCAEPRYRQPEGVSAIAAAPAGDALDQATDSLPEQQRIAIILSHQVGLSNGDIAAVMGATNAAVETLLKQARRSLRGVFASPDLSFA